jgi:hypothetical protein
MTRSTSLIRKPSALRLWFYRPRLERLEDRTVPSFIVAGSYPAGKFPDGVAAGDFRDDGILDLAVTASNDGNVNVLLGNGDGTFQSAVSYYVGYQPGGVVVGDFNGDGIPDLAVTKFTYPTGKVGVLLGNGDGTFRAQVNYDVSADPISVAVGDFNGDGIQDLAVGTTGMVSILLGNGDGSFQHAGDYKNGQGSSLGADSVTVADFNGDGVQDIAVANYLVGDTVSVLLGNGDGSFQDPKSFYAGADPEGLASADLNSDGIPDLVATDYGGSNGSGSALSVLLCNGDGSFQAPIQYDVGKMPDTVAIGDWNGDGVPDLAVGNDMPTDTLHTLLGNGDGTFQAAESYDAGTQPRAVATGDFNGDGAVDLAVADRSVGNTLTVLLNANDWDTRHLGEVPATVRTADQTGESPPSAELAALPGTAGGEVRKYGIAPTDGRFGGKSRAPTDPVVALIAPVPVESMPISTALIAATITEDPLGPVFAYSIDAPWTEIGL